MVDCVIFHYEDEPQRVDLPGRIEVALYQHADVTRSSIEELRDSQDYLISYCVNGQNHSLRYVIEESIQEACTSAEREIDGVLLHLVDRQIGVDAEAGMRIVTALQAQGVPNDRIWMVTAYEVQAKRDLRASAITVYPKPSPVSEMVQIILGLLEQERAQ